MNQAIQDLELVELIGEGRYGSVYRAAHAEFGECAVRLFNPAAVNRRVLSFALQKAISIPSHPALMQVYSLDLGASPGNCITELLGERVENDWQVTTMADRAGTIPEKDCWNILYEIAGALDHLHKFGIAHCDVAARNLIFHRNPGGELTIKVTGFGMGVMADVPELDIGREILRLAPEQLLYPEGIYEGAAFGWDVYSFGILAYRILTGHYPRGEKYWVDNFVNQSGKEFDAKELVSAIQNEESLSWPATASAVGIRRCRKVVEDCLAIDPSARPVDLRDVRERFDQVRHSIETQGLRAEAEKAKEGLGQARGEVERIKMETESLAQRKSSEIETARQEAIAAAKAELQNETREQIEKTRTAAFAQAKEEEKKLRADAEAAVIAARNQAAQQVAEARDRIKKKLRVYKWVAIVAMVAASALIALTLKYRRDVNRTGIASGEVGDLEGKLVDSDAKVAELTGKLATVTSEKEAAESRAMLAEESSAEALGEIEKLISRIIEKGGGVAELPEAQLETVLNNYEAMLENPAIKNDELQRGLKLYDVAVLRQRLNKEGVLDAYSGAAKTLFDWLNGAVDHDERLNVLRRLAKCEEESYKLYAEQGKAEEAINSLRACTGVYDSILDETPDDGDVVLSSARSHFALGQFLRFQDRNDEALEAQSRVIDALSDINNYFKESKTLKEGQFLRARSMHETGLAERQKSEIERAITAQLSAVEELIPLAHAEEAEQKFMFRLGECYTELGELISHHKNFPDGRGAHDEAVRVLLKILNEDLGHDDARNLLARNYGELAWIDREEGDLKSANARLDACITIYKEMVRRLSGQGQYVFRLARYQALKSEILSEQDQSSAAITFAQDAVGSLENLVARTPNTAPAELEQYKIALAHAFTSLGFANAEAGKKEPSKESYNKAVTLWQELSEANPKDKLIADRLEISKRELQQFE